MAGNKGKKEDEAKFDSALRQLINAGHIAQERGEKATDKPPAKKPAK